MKASSATAVPVHSAFCSRPARAFRIFEMVMYIFLFIDPILLYIISFNRIVLLSVSFGCAIYFLFVYLFSAWGKFKKS